MTTVELNQALTTCGSRFSLAVTGAGMTGATAFFTEMGASAFIDEIRIPYCARSLQQLLQSPVEKAVSEKTAKELAHSVWDHRVPFAVGIGMTGKLIQVNERPGREHEVWAAAMFHVRGQLSPYITQRMVPTPGTRAEQECQASSFLHQFMLDVAGQLRR